MELHGKRIAVLVADQYEDLELWYPLLRLREAGAQVVVMGTGAADYMSKHGMPVQADVDVAQARVTDFEALVIPSGPASESLGEQPALTAFVQTAIEQGKVVAAVAPAGRSMAAYDDQSAKSAKSVKSAKSAVHALRLFSMKEDVVNGDGPYKDSAVIREGNLIVARPPVDLPAFCRMIMAALAEPPPPPPSL
jgi:protease I